MVVVERAEAVNSTAVGARADEAGGIKPMITPDSYMTISAAQPASRQPIERPIPPFDPLELTCSLDTRMQVKNAIPPNLEMVAQDHTLIISYDWLLDVIDQVTDTDVGEVSRRAQIAVDLVTAHVDVEPFTQFVGQMITPVNMMRATEILRRQDDQRQAARLPGFIGLLKHGLGSESVNPFTTLRLNVTCATAIVTAITAEKFRAATGREPAQDNLERCNCKSAGEIGHWSCGWCEACDKPRFVCGHLLQRES